MIPKVCDSARNDFVELVQVKLDLTWELDSPLEESDGMKNAALFNKLSDNSFLDVSGNKH
jgi:hypothetical protein